METSKHILRVTVSKNQAKSEISGKNVKIQIFYPEVGISRQRLCNHAIHLNNIELQEQIIKQQFGEELLPQRRQLKYKARSKVLLPILEVFGKVFKQSLSFCYVFSIRTKTKKKQKNKIIGIQMLSWS